MSKRDVVQRLNDATERHDEDALKELVAEDAVWDMSRSRSPYQGIYHGHDEIRAMLIGAREVWEEVRFETGEVYEKGDLLAVDISAVMRGRGSGLELEARGGRVYEFSGGKVVRFVMFQSFADAREFVDAQP